MSAKSTEAWSKASAILSAASRRVQAENRLKESPAKNKESWQVEYLFHCDLEENAMPKNGSKPDKSQIGVNWLHIEQLHSVRLFPQGLADILKNLDLDIPNIYHEALHP